MCKVYIDQLTGINCNSSFHLHVINKCLHHCASFRVNENGSVKLIWSHNEDCDDDGVHDHACQEFLDLLFQWDPYEALEEENGYHNAGSDGIGERVDGRDGEDSQEDTRFDNGDGTRICDHLQSRAAGKTHN